DQDAVAVGHLEEFFGLEFAFEADRVQSHVEYVTELVVDVLNVLAQHEVRSVAAAANENLLAVDGENAALVLVELGSHFANAEFGTGCVRNLAGDFEFEIEVIKIGRAHLRGPPEAGLVKV